MRTAAFHVLKMKLPFFYVHFICILAVVNIAFSTENCDPNFLRVCYYSPSKPPTPSQLNVTLCTHIIAGFATVSNGIIDLGNGTFKELLMKTTALKNNNTQLKVLLTVGGGGSGNGFTPAFGSLQNRTRFIASVLTVLNDTNCDGLDIDWEFPVWNDNAPADKENFILFMKDFKGAAPSLLLTVAVAAPLTIVEVAYNIPEMAEYVDFVNLMTYDFHDYFWYTPFTAHNSPLYKKCVEIVYFDTLNTEWAASYWNGKGMPKSKIMVGIPTYGHSYNLSNSDKHGVYAPASGVGMGGGSVTFTDVCNFLSSGATRVFDNESKVPYAYKGYDWLSYEDETSMLGKAEWIKEQGFGGAMTYNLNSDDWSGACNSTTFPLHKVLYKVLCG